MAGINFNIPEGADPLGIGIPDLGRSSYDPLATINQAFGESRQERLLNERQREADLNATQEWIRKQHPIAFNAKIASELNNDLVNMSKLAYDKYRAGAWSPFTPKTGQISIDRKLQQKQNEIIQKGNIAQQLSDLYKKQWDVFSNPASSKTLDVGLTQKRFEEAQNAKNINELQKVMSQPLLVEKPTDLNIQDWWLKGLDKFYPGPDKKDVILGKDKETGKAIIQTTSQKSAVKLRLAADRLFRTLKESPDYNDRARYNYLKALYETAPKEEKTDKSGHTIDLPDWYLRTHSPSYAKSIQLKMQGQSTNKLSLNDILPQRDNEGNYNISDRSGELPIGIQVNTSTSSYNRRGKLVETKDISNPTQMDFESRGTIELGSINKPFVIYPTSTTIDTSTGKIPDIGKGGKAILSKIVFLPVYKGGGNTSAPVDVDLNEEKDSDGRTVSKSTYKLIPGNPVPKQIREELLRKSEEGGPAYSFEWKPFVISLVYYPKTKGEEKISDTESWPTDISSYNKTFLTPYKDMKYEVEGVLRKANIDPEKIDEYIKNVDAQINYR